MMPLASSSPPWRSMAFRLALYYGGLLLLTMVVVLAIFYVQMVGVLSARIDQQARQDLKRLEAHAQHYGEASLLREIRTLLRDGIDSQTEIMILADASGAMLEGNASILPQRGLSTLGLRELKLERNGRTISGRVAVTRLSSGHLLIVGSDMEALRDIEQRFMHASLSAVVIVVILALSGSVGFRRLVDDRATHIRRTLQQVAAGDMRQRIPLSEQDDEFTRLSQDINKMLDQIEQLMEGIRHVSNAIAHNLRTPLTRILLQMRSARMVSGGVQQRLLERVEQEVQDLGTVFEKLLQIAELESGMRRQEFSAVDLTALLADIEDLYAPVAEDAQCTLQARVHGHPCALGDADLLASALSNLVENALKYACTQAGGRITLSAQSHADHVEILVLDNGPGVPPERLPQLTQRFFRAHERQPGHGLGLSSVQAIVALHGGHLEFTNRHPGFVVRLQLPAFPVSKPSLA